MKAVLDTNFLVSAMNFKVDVLLELRGYEVCMTQPVIEELEAIASGNDKDAVSARLSLKLVEDKNLEIIKTKEKEADYSLLEMAKQGFAVATQDKRLKEKLKIVGSEIIFIRQKKYVVFE
ncbi:MAG: hypothetical protein JW700_02985 [Candidatus Aenigmarchaeota archaeon]|nr:hypothetical protein [Candidatus Aenigmarchaeota archaeon]